MLVVNNVFPTQVYYRELPGWVNIVKNFVYGFIEAEKGRQKGRVIQTPDLTRIDELSFLKDFFIKESTHILFGQGYNTDLYNFYVKDMWAQEFREGGYNWPHVHSSCAMVGLYFFQVENCTPQLCLHDPRPGKTASDLEFREPEFSSFNMPILCNMNLKAGTFVFLNSWLTHSVALPQASSPLKFIHFNLSCERKIL